MRSKNFIPLPEVGEHTDMIEIRSLGLPVGFDQERLAFNIGAIEKSMKWGGLGSLVIGAKEGEQREVQAEAGSVNMDGTASSIGKIINKKVKLQNYYLGKWSYDSNLFENLFYDKAEVRISINSTEKEHRILDKEKRWPKGSFDPKAQAYFLDQTISTGLKGCTWANQLTDSVPCGTTYSLASIVAQPSFAAIFAITNFGAFCHALYKKRKGLPLSERKWSILPGVFIDRQIMAHAQATRTLVKAIN